MYIVNFKLSFSQSNSKILKNTSEYISTQTVHDQTIKGICIYFTATKKVPTPPNAQPDIARSLPAYVPDTPGKKEKGPRTPHSKKEEMAPRFYPVVKDSSRPHDPQVFAQMRPFIDIRGILCYPFLLLHVCMPLFDESIRFLQCYSFS